MDPFYRFLSDRRRQQHPSYYAETQARNRTPTRPNRSGRGATPRSSPSTANNLRQALWEAYLILVNAELSLIWKLQKIRQTYDLGLVDWMISPNMLQDISIVLWFAFFGSIADLGFPYVWICVGNFVVAALLQQFSTAMRPFDFDKDLESVVLIDKTVGAFPSLESHMAVVVLIPIILISESVPIALGLILLGCLVAFSRIYCGGRFIHQIFGSMLTGFSGLLIGTHGHIKLADLNPHKDVHVYSTIGVVTAFVFLMAMRAESQESKALRVPKEDYLNVISSILDSDPTNKAVITDAEDMQDYAKMRRMRRKQAKQDSFYHLMSSLERRSTGSTAASAGTSAAPYVATGEQVMPVPWRPGSGASSQEIRY